MTSVSAHVAAALVGHVEVVFGLMGNGNAHFLDAILRDTEVTFTAVRHEAGAVAAADTYHRASGRLAAASVTYGAGFTNTLTALAEAAQARIPLVLVVGDEPTAGPRPWDVDQVALATAVGVRTFRVGRADAAATTSLAMQYALVQRVPVVVAIPYDLAKLEVGEVALSPVAVTELAPEPIDLDPRSIAELAAALRTARRPFLLAGRGAWISGAGEALGALAAATGAVTASTSLGRGLFPDGRFDLGVTGGFGADGAMDLVREADLAVVFGASLNQFTMRFGNLLAPGTRVVQVDVGPAATHRVVSSFVRGDAAAVARALVAELAADGADGLGAGWRDTVDLAPLREYEIGEGIAPDGRLDPRTAAARIGELLPADRVVVSDGGHFLGWANMYWPVASPDRMIMVGTAYQTIGLGWPSVPGAAAARPESTIVLTTGDGGGLMALADLETAVRTTGGRGIAVVWNDAAYGAEVHLYGQQGLDQRPMLIPEVDFAALGSAVGAEGVVVRTPADLERLGEWAKEDPAERRFLLLDLRVSPTVVAPYQQEIIHVNR